MNDANRPDALRSLATRLIVLDKVELLSMWSQGLPRLAQRSRADLLADLGALAPVIKRLGGIKVLDAIDEFDRKRRPLVALIRKSLAGASALG